jgi:hypothetical protein
VEAGILIDERVWRRLIARVRRIPEPSTGWLALSSLLAGIALSYRSLELTVAASFGAVICLLAHRAVNAGRRQHRDDIAEELEFHDPSRR